MTQLIYIVRRAMAQAVSRFLSPQMPGFKPGPVHVEFLEDKVALGQAFSKFFGFLLSVLFHLDSILIYYLGVNNRSVGSRSSET
jgi:hypothetical protein